MIESIVYVILLLAGLGLIELFLIFYVQKKFKFNFPTRNYDDKISIKKLRKYVNENQKVDGRLLKKLKLIILVNRIGLIVFTLMILLIVVLLVVILI